MATRLAKGATRFLPFNRGSDPGAVQCGKGNPPRPVGVPHRLFLAEVLQRDRFLDILGSYLFVETRTETVYDNDEARTVDHEMLVFPAITSSTRWTNLSRTHETTAPGATI